MANLKKWIPIGVLVLFLLVTLFSSFYMLQEDESAVVQTFGSVKYV